MNKKVIEAAKIVWEWLPYNDPTPDHKVDMIFVLGNKSDQLPTVAAKLYSQGLAPIVVVSGSRGRITKHDPQTEAERYSDALVKDGVPIDIIIREERATNSGENITFTKTLLEEKKITLTRAIAVTTAMLSRRHQATLSKNWSEIDWSISTPEPVNFNDRLSMDNPDEFLNLMAGEVSRLMLYPLLGYMQHVAVPHDVFSAAKTLFEFGYTKYRVSQ